MLRTTARIRGIQIQSSLAIAGLLVACSSGQPSEPTPSDAPTTPPATPSPAQPAQAKARGLIVKFKSEGAASVTEDAQLVFSRRRSFALATADGSRSLDLIATRHGFKQAVGLVAWRAGMTTAAAKRQQAARWTTAAQQRRSSVSNPALAIDPTNIY